MEAVAPGSLLAHLASPGIPARPGPRGRAGKTTAADDVFIPGRKNVLAGSFVFHIVVQSTKESEPA